MNNLKPRNMNSLKHYNRNESKANFNSLQYKIKLIEGPVKVRNIYPMKDFYFAVAMLVILALGIYGVSVADWHICMGLFIFAFFLFLDEHGGLD